MTNYIRKKAIEGLIAFTFKTTNSLFQCTPFYCNLGFFVPIESFGLVPQIMSTKFTNFTLACKWYNLATLKNSYQLNFLKPCLQILVLITTSHIQRSETYVAPLQD